MQARKSQRGITLVECTMTAAIAVIVLGSAMPSFQQMNARRQVEGPAVELATNLMFARSEAVSHNESVRVSFQTTDAGACYVIHTGSASDCECGGAGPAQCANGAREIKTVRLPAGQPVTLHSNVGSMLFHPVRGTVTPTGALELDGPLNHTVRVAVNVMGRVRACTPSGNMPGYKPC